MSKRKAGRLKTFAFRSVTVLISIFITLVLVELCIRLLAPQPKYYQPQYLYSADDELGVVLTPGFEGRMHSAEGSTAIRINTRGLRDREHEDSMPFRILGLGDSFTFGTMVELEKTFLAILETRLAKEHTTKSDVVKAGITGYGTDQEYKLLTKLFDQYRPNVVLLFFYLNDVLETSMPDFTVEDGYCVPPQNIRRKGRRRRRTMKRRLAVLMNSLHSPSFLVNRLSNVPAFRKAFSGILAKARREDAKRLQLYCTENTTKTDEKWALVGDYLKKISAFTSEKGSKLLVAYIPENRQADIDLWGKDMSQFSAGKVTYDRLHPNAQLAEICRKEAIPFLDMTSEFKTKVEGGGELYFTLDPHFNNTGHDLAAQLIYEKLLDEELLPD